MKSKNLGMGKRKQLEDKLVGDAVRRCPVSAFYRLILLLMLEIKNPQSDSDCSTMA